MPIQNTQREKEQPPGNHSEAFGDSLQRLKNDKLIRSIANLKDTLFMDPESELETLCQTQMPPTIERKIEDTKNFLSTQFQMKDLGIMRYFLGIEVDSTPQGLFLSQKKYASDLLKQYRMSQCKSIKLPMDSHLKLTPDIGEPLPEPTVYQRLIGKLIYLTLTRPNIAFPIHVLSQFMHKPTTVHYQAAKRVLRYLSGSLDQGLLLASISAAHLQAYCDSDWAGCPITRGSTSGFCIMLGYSPISWKSKRQSVVSRSSAKAEYSSMALTICEVMWLTQLLQDLGLTNLGSTPLFCDNQAALAIFANLIYHEKMKHVDIDCHFIKDKVQDGVVFIKDKVQAACRYIH